MTVKTGKNMVDEVEAVPAEAETEHAAQTEQAGQAEETGQAGQAEETGQAGQAEETGQAGQAGQVEETEQVEEKPARPAAKRKRRVRVIEVIDDEDLDEVLAALDAEDEQDEPPSRPAKPTAGTAAKSRPTRLEPPEEEQEEKARTKVSVRKDAAEPSGEGAPRPVLFGLPVVHAVVVIVVVALLTSLAIWQWQRASGLSSEQDDREAVRKVASAYGDVAFNYNAQNYKSQTDKAQELMGGDLLESFQNTTLPSLGETFKNNPEVSLKSETNQVFVGSVDERFATAVVMVDVDFTTKDGATSAPATLLRLALAKIDGEWKVTKQYASGAGDQNRGQRGLPATPTAGASKPPTPDESEKPGD